MELKQQPYPELRGLLTKYGITYEKLGEFLGKTKNTVGLKMTDQVSFKQSECKKIVDFFRAKGEKWVTVDKLFFAWRSTIVDKEDAV